VTLAAPVAAMASSAGPFGVARPDGTALSGSFGGWLVAQQAWFNREMAAALKVTAAHGSGQLLLISLGAIYGVLHAAGPGHGKAVISSYLFATGDTLRRGIVMAAAAAIVAIALVGVFGFVVGATAMTMDAVTLDLEPPLLCCNGSHGIADPRTSGSAIS
jgi:nickel/cobalt transporter (NicO) family protein